MKCKLCSSSCTHYATYDFNKNCLNIPFVKSFDVVYYKCDKCEFIFTRDLDDKNLSELVYNKNYIKFDPDFEFVRPVCSAKVVADLVRDPRCKILDYGGGNGITAKMVRMRGLNCDSYDPYFGNPKPTIKYDLIVAFEVMEHTTTPLETIEDMKSLADKIVVSTSAYESSRDNWYISPRNGHVSIYSYNTLKYLGFTSYSKELHSYVNN